MLAVGGSLPSGTALAQESRTLLQRVDHLERDLGMVQRRLYRGSAEESFPSRGEGNLDGEVATRLQQRFVDMEGVLSGLTGQVEEVRFEINQIRSRLEKLTNDVGYRLNELEHPAEGAHATADSVTTVKSAETRTNAKGTGPGTGRANQTDGEAIAAFGKSTGQAEPAGGSAKAPIPSPRKGNESESASLSKGSVKEQYEHISALLSQGDYGAAERAALAFLEVHPEDPLAGNAQYWLGETYYVRGDFRQAAVAFAKGYQKYAKSGKAAANVLKLGLSLAKLERVQDACTAFNRLAVEFPNTSSDIKQHAVLEKKRLGCK